MICHHEEGFSPTRDLLFSSNRILQPNLKNVSPKGDTIVAQDVSPG